MKEVAKKSASNTAGKTRAKSTKPVARKEEKVEVKAVTTHEVEHKEVKKGGITLNQDLNLLIGLFALLTLVAFGFAFEATKDSSLTGWELLLKSGAYSGVFKGFMIAYFITILVDCILTIHVDSENEIFNIIEKVLYTITLVMNFTMIVIFINLIKNIGIGLILFFILSIISILVKFVRVYAKR